MHLSISPDLTVKELLAQWPEAIPLFFTHHMSCVGCSMSGFDTIQDVAGVYQLNLSAFMDEIDQAVNRRHDVESSAPA